MSHVPEGFFQKADKVRITQGTEYVGLEATVKEIIPAQTVEVDGEARGGQSEMALLEIIRESGRPIEDEIPTMNLLLIERTTETVTEDVPDPESANDGPAPAPKDDGQN